LLNPAVSTLIFQECSSVISGYHIIKERLGNTYSNSS